MSAAFTSDVSGSQVPNSQPLVTRVFAHFLSFVFHPLFIPSYIVAFLLLLHPSLSVAVPDSYKFNRIASVFYITAFFPAFTVFLLKQLKFIDSIYLKTQKDRIIPIIGSMIFYFWAAYVSWNLKEHPLLKSLLLGVFLSSIAALMANIYFKVSLHAIAMGGLFIYFLLMGLSGDGLPGLYLSIAIIIAGAVCTARMLISDHHPFEIYSGFLFGVICQAVAIAIV